MNTFRNLSIIALAVTLLFGVSACFRHSPEQKAEWVTERITSRLELDETQKQKLDALKDEIMRARKDLQTDRESSFEQARDLVTREVLDKDAARALFDQKHQKFAVYADPVLDRLADFHASLNAPQKQQIAEFMDKHKERGEHRSGHHW